MADKFMLGAAFKKVKSPAQWQKPPHTKTLSAVAKLLSFVLLLIFEYSQNPILPVILEIVLSVVFN